MFIQLKMLKNCKFEFFYSKEKSDRNAFLFCINKFSKQNLIFFLGELFFSKKAQNQKKSRLSSQKKRNVVTKF